MRCVCASCIDDLQHISLCIEKLFGYQEILREDDRLLNEMLLLGATLLGATGLDGKVFDFGLECESTGQSCPRKDHATDAKTTF